MKIAVYGNSQAEPTGMGDDLVAELKKRKVEVKRIGLHGRDDAALLEEAKSIGDPADYDKIVLYCGGNNSKVPQTIKLIQYFGADKCIAVLPPINIDKVPIRVLPGGTAAYSAEIKKLVPVFHITEGHADDFKSDGVHLKPKTEVSQDMAKKIADLALGKQASKSNTAIYITVSAIAIAVMGFVLWRSSRNRV